MKSLLSWCKKEEEISARLSEEYWKLDTGLRYDKRLIAKLEKSSALHAHEFLKRWSEPRELRHASIAAIAGYKTYKLSLTLHELRRKKITYGKLNWNTWRAWALKAKEEERKEVFDVFIKKSKILEPVVRKLHERALLIYEKHGENPLDVYLEEHKIGLKELLHLINKIKKNLKRPFKEEFKKATLRFLGREPRYYDDYYFTRNLVFKGFAIEKDPLLICKKLFGRLGFSLSRITIDEIDRPGKSASAFCMAIRVPKDVRVSYRHESEVQTLSSVLHEMGHAVHESHIDERLPYWKRISISEGLAETFSTFFEGLLLEEEFLKNEVGLKKEEATDFLKRARVAELYMLAFYCANSIFKLKFWAMPLEWKECDRFYESELEQCLGMKVPGAYWKLHHILPENLVYVPSYLLATARACSLRSHFREKYERWWKNKKVGRELLTQASLGSDSPLGDFQDISPKEMLEELKCLNSE